MLSAVITALLFGVIGLIAANFVISVLRARQRQQRLLTKGLQPTLPLQSLEPHGGMMVDVQRETVAGVEKTAPLQAFTLSSSWYSRHRTLVSLSFLLMLFFGLFLQSGLADGAFQGLSRSFSLFSAYQTSDLKTVAHPVTLTASMRLVRIDSALRDQYYTDYQWHVWSYSSCSGISLEEVMDAYGKHLIAADVLQVEQNLGVWDTYNGLTGGEPAMAKVAAYFGFKANPHPPRTLQDIINVSNQGFPVIVGMPGHIFVVRGGDSTYVYLADSAPANRTVMTHQAFMSIWNGFSVLITPL